jgi:hypothetical protein
MISTDETSGTPSVETHDASRAPLPASTRVYVQGELHPAVQVPMREIAPALGVILPSPAPRMKACLPCAGSGSFPAAMWRPTRAAR